MKPREVDFYQIKAVLSNIDIQILNDVNFSFWKWLAKTQSLNGVASFGQG